MIARSGVFWEHDAALYHEPEILTLGLSKDDAIRDDDGVRRVMYG